MLVQILNIRNDICVSSIKTLFKKDNIKWLKAIISDLRINVTEISDEEKGAKLYLQTRNIDETK